MTQNLRPASSDELAAALAQALDGRHRADEMMSGIVAGELNDALDAAGFVVMRNPAVEGHLALGQGHREPTSHSRLVAVTGEADVFLAKAAARLVVRGCP
jgi:hypothetical protein